MSWETISGETPIEDISGLKIKNITTREELSKAEAENIRKVILKYLAVKPSRRQAPFDFNWSLSLHKEMFGDVWDWAGSTRQDNLNLGEKWTLVDSSLFDLLEGRLPYWKEHWEDPIEQAAHLHHAAVKIHPFLNGNGRWSRMMSNIWLKIHDHNITVWPEDAIGGVSDIRNEYLAAIRSADDGRMTELIELHRKYTLT